MTVIVIVIGLSGLLCGGVLGSRFHVFALVPAHLLATVAACLDAACTGLSVTRLVIGIVVWSFGCNAGYILGALARLSRRPARHDRQNTLPPLRMPRR